MDTLNWSWLLNATTAIIAGVVGARLLQRTVGPEQLRQASTSSIVLAITALVIAYFNVYPPIANGVAVFAFTLAASLRRKRPSVRAGEQVAPRVP
jgi:lysylphosphatidylglycerol synthetase-like protein (DUF2156 family)